LVARLALWHLLQRARPPFLQCRPNRWSTNSLNGSPPRSTQWKPGPALPRSRGPFGRNHWAPQWRPAPWWANPKSLAMHHPATLVCSEQRLGRGRAICLTRSSTPSAPQGRRCKTHWAGSRG